MQTILFIDDEENLQWIFKEYFTSLEYKVITTSNGAEGSKILDENNIDICITDIMLNKENGLNLIKDWSVKYSEVTFFVITAEDSATNIIKAIDAGAKDVFLKPINLNSVEAQLKLIQPKKQLQKTESSIYDNYNFNTKNQQMLEIYKTIGRITQYPINILIEGETGTGKEIIAQLIHSMSQKNNATNQPFLAVNMAAINENLIESELFGHVKGAFTGTTNDRQGAFELAQHGSIFLDEITELPLQLQSKLLRVIQLREFQKLGSHQAIKMNARLIVATNKVLANEVANGLFREDLFFRLNVVSITLPPLRERKEDLQSLINHFLQKYSYIKGKACYISKNAINSLMNYEYPGNIRELENIILYSIIHASNNTIDEQLIAKRLQTNKKDISNNNKQNNDIYSNKISLKNLAKILIEQNSLNSTNHHLDSIMSDIEKEIIELTCEKLLWNKSNVAKKLGITRNTLSTKMEKYDIHRKT